jgi:hypothetical protein
MPLARASRDCIMRRRETIIVVRARSSGPGAFQLCERGPRPVYHQLLDRGQIADA